MAQPMPSPHPGISLPARDACAQGALSRSTDRFAPSHGAHGPLPCPCSPGLPQIPVKLIVLLIDRALTARGLAEEPHGKLRVACVEFPAWCQHCLFKRVSHPAIKGCTTSTGCSPGSPGQTFGRRK